MAKPSNIVEIYALTCPDTGSVRYVGKANNHIKRFKSHISDSRRRDTPVYRWIRKLSSQGKLPGVVLLCHTWEWRETERTIIAQYKSSGFKLLNVADGGDEPYCSKETRAENGRRNAKLRTSTPFREKVYQLKRMMAHNLKNGYVTDSAKEKLRLAVFKNPSLFGIYACL